MADRETELEWEKSKRIEAERMKAARALEGNKDTEINSAFLEPENTKIKGYSRDESRILRSIEKVSGFSLGFLILGIVLSSMPRVMMIARASAPLTILFNILSYIGLVILFISPISAIVSLWSNYKYRNNDKSIIVTSVISLVIFLIYLVYLAIQFGIIK